MSEVPLYHGNDEQCLEFSIEYAGERSDTETATVRKRKKARECVCERERERESEQNSEKEKERAREGERERNLLRRMCLSAPLHGYLAHMKHSPPRTLQ